ncbi:MULTISPECIES: ROK family protein [unclassified Parafrankia]|uniref:ROK family protein n=1 Tax=unclassified Parafrankia TaxID=2994368 RepID=UPI000DA5E1CE|nr:MULTISPECIES: ROK family protein [unclassified Parafrankia]TCJ37723.1 ROK family protein [Parafrankia sp. BMG5.11]SQD96808.1 ROK family protein [Parafrankia sp. Ea1.12]
MPLELSGPRPTNGARQATLRESNLALVARTVAAAAPAYLSRADVAGATSMTRATASRLVDELVAGGVVDELGPDELDRPAPRRGRPGTPLAPGSRIAALGLQIDAGFLAARVINLRGQVLAEWVASGDLVASPPEVVLRRLDAASGDVLSRLPAGSRLVGARLALPGIVAVGEGRLLRAPTLGWSDLRPVDVLGAGTLAELPLTIGNEADLAAWAVAESAPGRAGPLPDFVYLSGGIGIGGAVVRDGAVITGRHGWAGEVGHVCVDPNGPSCPCGSTGCLERYAGRHTLLAAAGLADTVSPELLRERVAAGDQQACQAVAVAAWALGIALASVINMFDVPTVVLGGYLGQIAGLLRADLDPAMRARVLSARWAAPAIVAAEPGAAPGATGAAFAELAAVIADPARWTVRPAARDMELRSG